MPKKYKGGRLYNDLSELEYNEDNYLQEEGQVIVDPISLNPIHKYEAYLLDGKPYSLYTLKQYIVNSIQSNIIPIVPLTRRALTQDDINIIYNTAITTNVSNFINVNHYSIPLPNSFNLNIISLQHNLPKGTEFYVRNNNEIQKVNLFRDENITNPNIQGLYFTTNDNTSQFYVPAINIISYKNPSVQGGKLRRIKRI